MKQNSKRKQPKKPRVVIPMNTGTRRHDTKSWNRGDEQRRRIQDQLDQRGDKDDSEDA